MNARDPTDSPTDIRIQLRDAGWSSLIPVQGKVPAEEGWPRRRADPANEAQIRFWTKTCPHAHSTGIVCGDVIGIDIDVLSDRTLAHELRALTFKHFGYTPFRRVGQAPKELFVYRAAEPISSRGFKAASGNGDGIDILSAGRQFVAFGTHEKTRRPYEWIGDASPLEEGPESAPAITEAQVEVFLDAAHRLMPLATGGGKVGEARGGGIGHGIVRNDAGLVTDGREAFLTQCVWRAAGRIDAAGEALAARTVADLGWQLFATDADLADGKWTKRDALQKAGALVRRYRAGTLKFRKPASAAPGVEPTYAADMSAPVAQARARTATAIGAFIEAAAAWREESEVPAPVHAIRVSTGVGKTTLMARLLAEHRSRGPRDCPTVARPWVFAVPTHRLGDGVAEQFRQRGLKARVFRGRKADNPAAPGEKMCGDPDAVDAALALGEPVQTACCKAEDNDGNELKCPLYDVCAYQRQKSGKPDVWVIAHDSLFHAQSAFGDIGGVIIDEGFWQTAIPEKAKALTLDELRQTVRRPERGADDEDLEDLSALRSHLARAIVMHGDGGGLRRDYLEAAELTAAMCKAAGKAEWRLKPAVAMWPGMPREARREAMRAAAGTRYVWTRAAIWKGAREILETAGEGDASGRVYISHQDEPHQREPGHGRVTRIHARLLKAIATRWADVPTFIMDATLPDLDLIRPLYPHAALTEEAEAEMPHAHIWYVTSAPTAAAKLASVGASERNVRDVRRYILARWLEHGRKPGLVICQKGAEEKLKALGLPEGTAVEHFNAIAGLDDYKDVGWYIQIGSTTPKPQDVEALAGVISGVECEKAKPAANGRPWYESVERGIRLKGKAEGVAVRGFRHPDPLAEAIRSQICEGELMQALGRVRAVNRTKANPVSIYILTDVVLPVEADDVVAWKAPSRAVEMLTEGVLIESPADMTRLFPAVWPNLDAAKREGISGAKSFIEDTVKESAPEIGRRLVTVRYRPQGRGQSWRAAHFDLSVIPDPHAWLEKRLGRLAGFEAPTVAAEPAAKNAATERSVNLALMLPIEGGANRPSPIPQRWRRTEYVLRDGPLKLRLEAFADADGASVPGRVDVSCWRAAGRRSQPPSRARAAAVA